MRPPSCWSWQLPNGRLLVDRVPKLDVGSAENQLLAFVAAPGTVCWDFLRDSLHVQPWNAYDVTPKSVACGCRHRIPRETSCSSELKFNFGGHLIETTRKDNPPRRPPAESVPLFFMTLARCCERQLDGRVCCRRCVPCVTNSVLNMK